MLKPRSSPVASSGDLCPGVGLAQSVFRTGEESVDQPDQKDDGAMKMRLDHGSTNSMARQLWWTLRVPASPGRAGPGSGRSFLTVSIKPTLRDGCLARLVIFHEARSTRRSQRLVVELWPTRTTSGADTTSFPKTAIPSRLVRGNPSRGQPTGLARCRRLHSMFHCHASQQPRHSSRPLKQPCLAAVASSKTPCSSKHLSRFDSTIYVPA